MQLMVLQNNPDKPSSNAKSRHAIEFGKASDKLRKLRADHSAWETAVDGFMAQHDALLFSHVKSIVRTELNYLLAIEKRCASRRVRKATKSALSRVIAVTSAELIKDYPDSDCEAELIALFDRHSTISYARLTLEKMTRVALRIGIDPAPLPHMSVDQMRAYMEQETIAWINPGTDPRSSEACDCEKCRVERQAERLHAAALNALNAGATDDKSRLRELYRKLVRKLHPDREPDQDLRARKTEMMQAVNVAYRNKDMLGLMDLQAEVGLLVQNDPRLADDEFLGEVLQNIRSQMKAVEASLKGIKAAIKGSASDMCPLPSRLSLKCFDVAIRRMREQSALEIGELELDISDVARHNEIDLLFWAHDRMRANGHM